LDAAACQRLLTLVYGDTQPEAVDGSISARDVLRALVTDFAAAPVIDSIRVEPPVAWAVHSRRVFDAFRREQDRMLAVFGLDPAIPVDEIAATVRVYADAQVREGDLQTLKCPVRRRDGSLGFRPVDVFQGHDNAAMLDAMLGKQTAPIRPTQPLYRLWAAAVEVSRGTGVSEGQAVAFLLSDHRANLPWIDITTHDRSGPAGESRSVTIHVGGNLRVRPNEVAEAYREAVATFKPSKTGFTRQDEQTVELVRFMDELRAECPGRLPGGFREKAWREWNDTHPEWAYKTPVSMFNAAGQARKTYKHVEGRATT
jgi:hypothetical protein